MKLLRHLTMGLGLAACLTMSAQSKFAPSIIFPEYGKRVIIHGLSDNGNYAVSSVTNDVEKESGAILYEISGESSKIGALNETGKGLSAHDVTDDGNIVVGSKDASPHYWTNGKGWTKLPLPTGYSYGYATAVTPDGKYAVGRIQADVEGMQAQGCLWDLTTNQIVEVPANNDVIDLSGVDQGQNWYTQISADGRYIFGTVSFSYPVDTRLYVIDRDENRVIYIDADERGKERYPGLNSWETDVDAQALSPNGKWVAGTVDDSNGVDIAFYFDVENEELYVTDGKNQTDSWAWSITNDGIPLCTRPALDLYGECYVYYDNYYFSLADILREVYGVNPGHYGLDNTGKPVLVSADGLTIIMIASQEDSYILKLKENILEACKQVDLLKNWTSSPQTGSELTSINKIQIGFSQYVQTSATNYQRIQLLDSKGNVFATPLANNGLSANNNVVTIMFRSKVLEKGETYTLKVPAGIIWVDGRESSTNNDIEIKLIGRGNDPVAVTKVSPEDGSVLASLDVSDNPIILTYDSSVQINENAPTPMGSLFIMDEESGEESFLSPVVVAKQSDKQLIAYPSYLQYLYKGSKYKVVIPEGIAVDLSGQGPSKELVLTYEGSYVPDLGDSQYLFRSNCDDYSPFLFYDGDKGEPTAEYAAMNFTATETPWAVVRDDEASTDMAFGSHSCYVDGRQADDWFAIRQIQIPEGESAYLSFDSQSYRKSKQDYLKVYVYAYDGTINVLNDNNTQRIRQDADLVYNELQSPGANEGIMAGEWTHNVISLDDYAGKNILICFVNDNQNQSMVMVDNIAVVRDLKTLITLTNKTNVVNEESVVIKGILNVLSEQETYKGLNMTLKDAAGNEISNISDPNLTLSYGELYNFEFSTALPLELGVENPFTIQYKLGEEVTEYKGVIRDLTFEPTKRVILEKFTGRDCQYCPGGIAMLTRLEGMYGEQLIPIEIHGYNQSDPKGMNVLNYAQFFGFSGAPQAVINRRGHVSAPLYRSAEQNRYVATASNLSPAEAADAAAFPLWQDEIAAELSEAALMDIDIEKYDIDANTLGFKAKVRSALNLEDQNIRVFGVLLEDGLRDYQVNAYYLTDDELLGEWGKNGQFNQQTVTTWTFNNVARATWGQSYNGTAGLIPSVINSSEEYVADIKVPLPKGFVENPENLKFVVVLIDQNTGKVINANIWGNNISGVEGIGAENSDAPSISAVYGGVQIASATHAKAQVFTTSGMLLASGEGEGNFTLELNGYKGVAIVRAVNANGSVSVKLMVR